MSHSVGRNDPCPCGSSKKAKYCCMDGRGFFYKAPYILDQKRRHFSHNRCYMKFLGNCDTKISLEHFISSSISENKPAENAFHNDEQVELLFPRAVGARVLCTKHNSEFGDRFDAVGKAVFDAIGQGKAGSFVPPLLISGYDFERFLFQRLCAHHFGGVTAIGSKKADGFEILQEHLEQGFVHSNFEGGGLHLCQPPDYMKSRGGKYEFAPLYHPGGYVAGCRFTMWPVSFCLLMLPVVDDTKLGAYLRHPAGIRIGRKCNGRPREIIFSWSPFDTDGEVVAFDQPFRVS